MFFNRYAFLLTSPVVAVYLLAYFWIIQRPPESESLTKDDSDIQREKQRLLDSEDGELDEISGTLSLNIDIYTLSSTNTRLNVFI